MPSRAIILEMCDECDQAGIETPSTGTFSIGISIGENRPQVHVVLACDEHRKRIEELFAIAQGTVLLETGKPPVSSSGRGGAGSRGPYRPRVEGEYSSPREICPICGDAKARSAIAGHIWTVHLGATVRPKQPTECPDCDYVNDDGASMGQHRVKAHNYNGVAEAVATYELRSKTRPRSTPPPPELFATDDADADVAEGQADELVKPRRPHRKAATA